MTLHLLAAIYHSYDTSTRGLQFFANNGPTSISTPTKVYFLDGLLLSRGSRSSSRGGYFRSHRDIRWICLVLSPLFLPSIAMIRRRVCAKACCTLSSYFRIRFTAVSVSRWSPPKACSWLLHRDFLLRRESSDLVADPFASSNVCRISSSTCLYLPRKNRTSS